jgi:multiple sugar transport system permease protein
MLVFLLATTFLPILYVVVMSFFKNYLPLRKISFVLFQNYQHALSDPDFLTSFRNTAVYVFFSVLFHIVVALTIAVFLDRRKGRVIIFAKTLRTIFIVPWLISWAVAASFWILLLDPAGVLNAYAMKLGILKEQISWFGDPHYAMLWVIVITVWKAFPFFMMLLYAALSTVPNQLYEAADIDGASGWQKFYHVSFKTILPTIMTLTVLDIIWSIRQYDIIMLTTAGGPLMSTRTLTLQVYFTAFENLKFGLASAEGMLLMVLSMTMAILYVNLYAKAEI